jgi:ABC-type oligopeptide transport system ATPase subunit
LAEALLSLDAVSHEFPGRSSAGQGTVRAVDDVTLTFDPGSVLCLVGESGSGKTTTARIAAGLTRPTAGVVRFEGGDIHRADRAGYRRFRRAVQYIHQDPYASLNPIRDVLATLSAPLRHHNLVRGRDAARGRAAELLTEVDLTPPEQFLAKFPHQLSGGQRQRVAVARALTLGPRLIIADEATSMLDVSIRISLLSMLKRLRADLGVGFLFITHDLALARYFGWEGSTAVMHRGRVVEFGPTPDVIGRPTHEYTRALIAAIPEPDPDLSRRKRARAAADRAARA